MLSTLPALDIALQSFMSGAVQTERQYDVTAATVILHEDFS